MVLKNINHKDLKFINRTGNLPRYAEGKLGEKVMLAGIGALDLLGTVVNSSRPIATVQDIVNNAQGRELRIGTHTFQDFNEDSGESAAMSQANANVAGSAFSGAAQGAAAGSAFGPWGAGAGLLVGGALGVLGGNSAKKLLEGIIRTAKITKHNKTDNSFNSAQTANYRDELSENYGNLQNQQVVHVWDGKEPLVNPYTNRTYEKFFTNTSDGPEYRTANAMVKYGERIWDPKTNNMYRVKNGFNDDGPAYLKARDVVFSDDIVNPETGRTFAQDAPIYKKYDSLYHLTDLQAMTKMLNDDTQMKNKLFHAEFGKEIIPAVFNSLIGLNLIMRSNDPMSSPKSYVPNLSIGELNKLKDIRISSLPIYNNNREIESKTRNAIVRSGGLGASLISSALATNSYNTQRANAEELVKNQMLNNQYEANAINAIYQGNQQEAARKQQAFQWDYEKEAAAHNAMVQAWNTGAQNLSAAVSNYIKNNWERNMYEKMYKLYATDIASRLPNINTNKSQSWSLKGDISSKEQFDKFAPTPSPIIQKDKFGIPVKAPDFTPAFMNWTFKDMVNMRNKKRASNKTKSVKR